MTRVLNFCFMMMFVWVSGANAKSLSTEPITPSQIQTFQASAPTSPLAETARTMLHSYAEKRGVLRPLPRNEPMTIEAVQQRIAALMDSHHYAHTIVVGLSSAATPDEARDIQSELQVVLEHHNRIIFSAFSELLTAQDLSHDGWFVTSKFGSATERQAGQLLATGTTNRALLFRLLSRLEVLSAQGEASTESVHSAAKALGSAPLTKTLSSGIAG